MNRDDIIRMMRESHLDVYGLGKDREKFLSVVDRFANLVAAAEREACAQIAFNAKTYIEAANAIRERGRDDHTV